MSHQYSVWLLPEANHEARLASHMARLSAHLGGPMFSPHVTVQGDITLPPEPLAGLLGRLAMSTAPQRWRIDQVEASDHFFRCLYLRFAAEPTFTDMQHTMEAFTRTAQGLSPFAHLSLAYVAPHPGLARLLEPLSETFVGQSLVFDRLALCQSSKHLPIADWRCLEQYPLAAH